MNKKYFLPGLVFFLFITGIFSNPVMAGDPSGTWMSSSGSTIKLWANMQQVIVTVTTVQGQSFKYNGWWTSFSDKFAYQTGDGTNYASFANSNQINVKDPTGRWYIWTRGGNQGSYAPQAPQQQPNQGGYGVYPAPPQQQQTYSGISGNWRSSSGALIQVSTSGNQIGVTIIGSNGQRSQGIGRWLQPGYKFDYSIAGFQGVAIGTYVNPSQITVDFNGTRTIWSR